MENKQSPILMIKKIAGVNSRYINCIFYAHVVVLTDLLLDDDDIPEYPDVETRVAYPEVEIRVSYPLVETLVSYPEVDTLVS